MCRLGQGLLVFAALILVPAGPLWAQSPQAYPFMDDFETNQGWGIFEEIVGGSSCYGAGIGEVARTTDVDFEGSYSLRVWANKALSPKSNHVIGQKQISTTGLNGRFRYQLYAFIAPETANTGQTGPEFSMQNTRQVSPGQYRTTTAGIQYRANPFDTANYGSWAIWAEGLTPGVAGWQVFRTNTLLQAGEWYYMAIEADYSTNRYVRFWVRGPGVHLSLDVSGYRIAQETKFTQEAFWLTLESENLFNNCGTAGNFQYKVYYDDVKLKHLGAP